MKRSLMGLLTTPSQHHYRYFRQILDLAIGLFSLHLEPYPSAQEVTQRVLPGIPPTNAAYTEYALTALSSVLLATLNVRQPLFGARAIKVTTISNTYFETQGTLQELCRRRQSVGDLRHHACVDKLSDVPMDTDMIYAEPHPNNAASIAPIEPCNITKWLPEMMQKRKNAHLTTPLILVVDVTLNVLTDPEIEEWVKTAEPYLNSGDLCIFGVQSLVKFTTLGADVGSAGLLMGWSQNPRFSRLFKEVGQLVQQGAPPRHIQALFSYMLEHTQALQQTYLKTLQENTHFVSRATRKLLAEYGIGPLQSPKMDIHVNTDRHTCYISFTFSHLTVQRTPLSLPQIEQYAKKIYQWILSACKALKLLISNRQSFGFPVTNYTECYSPQQKAHRLNVGIEDKEALTHLSNVFAHAMLVFHQGFSEQPAQPPDEFIDEQLQYLVDTTHLSKNSSPTDTLRRSFKALYPRESQFNLNTRNSAWVECEGMLSVVELPSTFHDIQTITLPDGKTVSTDRIRICIDDQWVFFDETDMSGRLILSDLFKIYNRKVIFEPETVQGIDGYKLSLKDHSTYIMYENASQNWKLEVLDGHWVLHASNGATYHENEVFFFAEATETPDSPEAYWEFVSTHSIYPAGLHPVGFWDLSQDIKRLSEDEDLRAFSVTCKESSKEILVFIDRCQMLSGGILSRSEWDYYWRDQTEYESLSEL